jgi:hypothetical protein
MNDDRATQRRPLGDLLVEVAAGTLKGLSMAPALHARQVDLTLPIEFAVVWRSGEPILLGELPRWRFRTDFDQKAGSLRVAWREEELG